MILDGGEDDDWGANKGWKMVEKNDRVWVYYGTADGDLGIVGLALITSVKKPTKPNGRARLYFRWQRTETLKLLRDPFPAPAVREYIGHPQGPVWRIDPKLATSTVSYTPPKKVTVVRRHDALIRPLMHRLKAAGWTPMTFDIGTKKVDLAMKRKGQVVLVEAKTVYKSTNSAVREAFAQLAEYSWTYCDRRSAPTKPIVRWALFETQPQEDEIRFLEDQVVLVTWVSKSKRRFIHSPKTVSRVRALGL